MNIGNAAVTSVLVYGFLYLTVLALWLPPSRHRPSGATLVFGLAHFAGGTKYVILASFAGVGYGWVYAFTKRIEASIIMHFLLNLFHILLLTYPALAAKA